MITVFLNNLLSWSLQVTLLIAVAAVVSRRWPHAPARLFFWQGILALTLLLPFAAPWQQPPPEALPGGVGRVTATTVITGIKEPSMVIGPFELLLGFLIAGALFRLGWIGIGLLRLRLLRRSAAPLPDAPRLPFTNSRVRWYVSDRVRGPVTYGWLRPSILLPSHVIAMTDSAREAIACHELLHIERRDWLYVLVEEFIRAALWFHPAAWYALAQIQLAREEAVDREVVRRTLDRESYVDALLQVAAHRLEPDLALEAPAPLFLKKRHLAVRVSAVLQESSISTYRLASRFAAASTLTLAAAALAVWLFPLRTEAQVLPDDPGITVDAGGTLLHRAPLRLPKGASGGVVVVEATLNKDGEVSDARIVSGPEDLRRDTLSSVLQWHYASQSGSPVAVRISVQYGQNAAATPSSSMPEKKGPTIRANIGRAALPGWSGIVTRIDYGPMSADLQHRIEARLPVHKGDPISLASLPKMMAAFGEIDQHLAVTVRVDPSGGPDVGIDIKLASPPPPAPPPPPPPPAAETAATRQLRISGNVQSANLIQKVTPVYPSLAKQARIQGTVSFAATIDTEGRISNLTLISGHPLLVPSAEEAVRQWVYKPTLLNGTPVEIVTQIDVNYTLLE